MLTGDSAMGPTLQETAARVQHSCRNITEQVQKFYDVKKVKLKVKVITSATRGVTAVEGKTWRATWVVLDRHLKKEVRSCMEQLNCNLVLMSSLSCKVLRLNLEQSLRNWRLHSFGSVSELPTREVCRLEFPNVRQKIKDFLIEERSNVQNTLNGILQSNTLVRGSSELGTPFTMTEQGTSLLSSSEPGSSPYSCSIPDARTTCSLDEGASEFNRATILLKPSAGGIIPESESDYGSPPYTSPDGSPDKRLGNSSSDCTTSRFQDLIQPRLRDFSMSTKPQPPGTFPDEHSDHGLEAFMLKSQDINIKQKLPLEQEKSRLESSSRLYSRKKLSHFFSQSQKNANLLDGKGDEEKSFFGECCSSKIVSDQNQTDSLSLAKLKYELLKQRELEGSLIIRRAMLQSRSTVSGPPPLCSICRHKAPLFGMPPKVFSYKELELSTNGFSEANFLAEGGFGCVHKGLLPNGQAIAVKQYKMASSQGDSEFCSEVEVLSCAQHRNVVMLIGYCVEYGRRLLVYEFACNGSLNSHLYGGNRCPLEWQSRRKIAIGAARGLRYLHEECRVGCIVHLDLRPSNILLTHDFEPLVGDFGLARWKPQGDIGFKAQVVGTFGYMAPEYVQNGQITEKADVYSFGVVLLELLTGRKAVDIFRPKGQQFLTEWARPLLEEQMWHEMLDPQLEGRYNIHEATSMMQAASLCIQRNPQCRPRLSQVLRILEGDLWSDSSKKFSNRLSYERFPSSGCKLAKQAKVSVFL
ncbi:hypothetical protein O6H91_06G054500 [Diphasiastrum complanatum]|nr:hypothetical protein O6H91_06G054500 [Diphasiastrum complanatum]